MEQFETLENVVANDYTEVLTMIYDILVVMNEKMDLLALSLFILVGILAGSIAAAASVYFIGQMMRGK